MSAKAIETLTDQFMRQAFVARDKTPEQSAREFFTSLVDGYLTKCKWDDTYGVSEGTVSLFTEDDKPFEGIGVAAGDTILVAPGTGDELEGKVLDLADSTTLYIPQFGEDGWASGTYDLPYTIYAQETSDVRTEGDSPFNLAVDNNFALSVATELGVRRFFRAYGARRAETWAEGLAEATQLWLTTAVFLGGYSLRITQPSLPVNDFRRALIRRLDRNLKNELSAKEAARAIATTCNVYLSQATALLDGITTVPLVPEPED